MWAWPAQEPAALYCPIHFGGHHAHLPQAASQPTNLRMHPTYSHRGGCRTLCWTITCTKCTSQPSTLTHVQRRCSSTCRWCLPARCRLLTVSSRGEGAPSDAGSSDGMGKLSDLRMWGPCSSVSKLLRQQHCTPSGVLLAWGCHLADTLAISVFQAQTTSVMLWERWQLRFTCGPT